MVDEANLSQEWTWFNDQRVKTVMNNLQKHNISAQYVPDRKAAFSTILEMVPPGAVIARGDSVTMDQIGIIEELEKRGQNRIIDPFKRTEDGHYFYPDIQKRKEIARGFFTADIFLVGTNAVTLDGKLVNTDAWGNRVSAMIFGPDKVIIAVGINKIVEDVNEAQERIHNLAAPMNAKRHALKHHRADFAELPCAKTGICANCNNDWRLCRYTVIIEGTMIREKGRINVVVVGESLGI